jgi:hypothetical protein
MYMRCCILNHHHLLPLPIIVQIAWTPPLVSSQVGSAHDDHDHEKPQPPKYSNKILH